MPCTVCVTLSHRASNRSRVMYFYHLMTCTFPFSLPSGLVGHVCNMFTVTATLCLDGDNKNSIEPAATLLASLLDILLGMLTHTSRIVRQALQVSGPHHPTPVRRFCLCVLCCVRQSRTAFALGASGLVMSGQISLPTLSRKLSMVGAIDSRTHVTYVCSAGS